jgi:hypothetical protein
VDQQTRPVKMVDQVFETECWRLVPKQVEPMKSEVSIDREIKSMVVAKLTWLTSVIHDG